jgi:gliding motility-associated-like protein
MLIKSIFISFIFLSFLNCNAQIQKGLDIDGVAFDNWAGYSVSLSADGNTLAVGSNRNDLNGTNAGQARVFFWNGANWIQKGQSLYGINAFDLYGASVSLSDDGNTLAVGAYLNDLNANDAGLVQIFDWNGSSWVQKGSNLLGNQLDDWFGRNIELNADGNTIVIGAYGGNSPGSQSGDIKVFDWNGASWVQKGNTISGSNSEDWFGYSVAISADGNTIAGGAPTNDDNGNASGHVKIYEWNGTNWAIMGTPIIGEATNDWFGFNLSLNAVGDKIVIGAPYNDAGNYDLGKVKTYQWNGSNWIQYGNALVGSNNQDWFGFNVSMNADGNFIGVSTLKHDGNGINSGAIEIYKLINSVWTLQGQTIIGEHQNDKFGIGISLNNDGSVIAGGSNINSDAGLEAGHARVFCIPNYSEDTVFACGSYTWIDGVIYFQDTDSATVTLINSSGCDSIITLHLTLSNSSSIDSVSTCNSYQWIDGNIYTNSTNTATYTLPNSMGCDSLITLNLDLGFTDTIYENITACNSYVWSNGTTYVNSVNNELQVLTNQSGCDSIRILNLNIIEIDTSISVLNNKIISNTVGLSYQWISCDHDFEAIYGENSQYFETNTNGDFAVIVSNQTCSDTSECVNINVVGEIGVPDVFSPNNDNLNDVITVDGIGIESMTFKIYNRYGQKVFESNNQSVGWDGSYKDKPEPEGVYIWILEYKLITGEYTTLKGNLTLLR